MTNSNTPTVGVLSEDAAPSTDASMSEDSPKPTSYRVRATRKKHSILDDIGSQPRYSAPHAAGVLPSEPPEGPADWVGDELVLTGTESEVMRKSVLTDFSLGVLALVATRQRQTAA